MNEGELEETLQEIIDNIDIEKECWIVQPGISKRKLENDSDNKIHCLLNYIDSICRTVNIKFRFICSK